MDRPLPASSSSDLVAVFLVLVSAVAEAPGPHSALRKSFHFMVPRVPASFAASYLALQSFMDRPLPASSSSDLVAVVLDLLALVSIFAEAPGPHSALRKSFHLMSPSVPASFAPWYLALQSFMERPLASPSSSWAAGFFFL